MPRLPSTGTALLLSGLLLASLPAAARIVPPAAPDPAQRGGEALPPANKQGCPEPNFCSGAPLPSTYIAWFLLPQLEALTRLNAQDRFFIAARRGDWRAPRVGGRALLLRRPLLARQRAGR
ncbi:hypothetical protein E2C06_28390 [Dankookia rubra]|uniref:Uncharacterized protein n=1 Tax=Dankookia rubra TaxID=1442381 RepID=A0A4R5Q8G6_9PROT|nr:hypothetical protein [Dankookia rubra]TDH59244.1 hypothetical protein E2C06_28390 [Dankookia rubra]